MLGHALGQVYSNCIEPFGYVYKTARFHYYPRVCQVHEMAKHGISIGINDEVIFV